MDGTSGGAAASQDRAAEASQQEPVISLCHVAGLTSGQSMLLQPGSYQFGPSEGDGGGLDAGEPLSVSFELEVRSANDVLLSPRRETVSIEGNRITRPMPIEPNQIIHAGPDQFVLVRLSDDSQTKKPVFASSKAISVPSVQPRSLKSPWLLYLVALLAIVAGLYLGYKNNELWYLLAVAGGIIGIGYWLRRKQLARRFAAEHGRQLLEAKANLNDSLGNRRHQAAQERRSELGGPIELIESLSSNAHTPFSKRIGNLSLASGSVDWNPPLAGHRSAGWDVSSLTKAHSHLPAVPISINPEDGPFAVVGPRNATLATGRYLLLSAANRLGPSAVAIDSDHPTDWEWATDIATADPAEALFVVQDRSDTGFLPARGIALVDTNQPIPDGAQSVLSIRSSGSAVLLGPSSEPIHNDLVPFGMAEETASQASIALLSRPRAEQPRAEQPRAEQQYSQTQQHSSDHGPTLLFVAQSATHGNALASSVAIDLAKRRAPETLAVVVIDAGDRGLIRLWQLPHTVAYAPIDNPARVSEVVDLINRHLDSNDPDKPLVTLVISDLVALTSYLNLSGQQEQAQALGQLSRRTDGVSFVIAASHPHGQAIPESITSVVTSTVTQYADGGTLVSDSDGTRKLEIETLSGQDLTLSVAEIHRLDALV